MGESSRPNTLIRAAATVGGFTMISRLTGFARDILMAALLGAGPIGDAFFVAFKLPNFFRRLFAEGAFNAAFVPVYSATLETEGPSGARRFAEETLSVLLTVLLLVTAVLQMAMPVVMLGLAPGFVDDPPTFDLAVELTQITFPYLMFISLVSLLAGVLNSHNRFAAAAATPILLNICLIGSLLGLVHFVPTAGHALAIGVLVAGIVQFLWLMLALHRAGLSLRLPRPRLTPGVRKVMRIMAPAALGAGVVQVNLVIDIILASTLPEGSISFLFYADRVNQLPIGVVGVAVGTALLPLLSRQAAAGETAAARNSLNRAVELGLLMAIPAAAACLAMPDTLIAALFERGAFTPEDTAMTAWALSAYAVGLPAYVMVKVLGPAFFARQDTATPVKIAIIAVIVNVVLNLILMGPMLHAGLALATAISAWLNTGLLALFLHRRGYMRIDRRLGFAIPKSLSASALMAGALIFGVIVLDQRLPGGEAWRALGLALLVVGGVVVYGGFAWISGLARPSELKSLLRGR